MKVFLFVAISVFTMLVSVPGSVFAQTLTVTTAADVVDDTDSAMSLREALDAAQPQDVIAFDASLSGRTILLRLGQLVIANDVTIEAPDNNGLTIDGNGASRVLAIENGANVTIRGVTIIGGNTSRNGGGILNNDGTLTLVDCTVSGNTGGAGGGIFNVRGNLTLQNCTLSSNRGRGGGGIFNQEGTVDLVNSTISDNIGVLSGGGLSNNAGQISLSHTTVTHNEVEIANGGGLTNDGGTVQLTRSIIAGNTAFASATADCSTVGGELQSLGSNIVGAGTGCPTSGSGDQSIDPAVVFTSVLGPLQDNGGASATRALLPGSPAIDAASACPPPSQDQRGIARPQGAACDIGAYEARQDNQRPVANAGPDQQVEVPARVRLDGSASSDPENDPMSYQWRFVSQPAGSAAVLETPMEPTASFIADQAGVYEVELLVRDHDSATGISDAVRITAIAPATNRPPIANAGSNQQVELDTRVVLDGSASSDPESDPISYEWGFIRRPSGSAAVLETPTESRAAFVPDQVGDYEVELQVRDDSHPFGEPGSVRITAEIRGSTNQRPIANAGADQTVIVGAVVTLNGSASNDPDGNVVRYEWAFISQPINSQTALANATGAVASFEAHFEGTYEIQLRVYDSFEGSAPDTIRITATREDDMSGEGGGDDGL